MEREWEPLLSRSPPPRPTHLQLWIQLPPIHSTDSFSINVLKMKILIKKIKTKKKKKIKIKTKPARINTWGLVWQGMYRGNPPPLARPLCHQPRQGGLPDRGAMACGF